MYSKLLSRTLGLHPMGQRLPEHGQNGQPKTTINGQVKTTEIRREIGATKVIITKFKQLDQKDQFCHAAIRIIKTFK